MLNLDCKLLNSELFICRIHPFLPFSSITGYFAAIGIDFLQLITTPEQLKKVKSMMFFSGLVQNGRQR